jgi:uncharacterized OsmC-like protein
MSTAATQHRNGVNVTQLVDTIAAIRENPELARFRFRAATEWQGGGATVTRIQGLYGAGQEDTSRTVAFELKGDEPPVLLGENSGPNAVEAVLHALASCLAVGFTYNAAAQGITVHSLRFATEGELDLHGFLGLRDDVRPGYSKVRVTYDVDCDATPEQVDELCAYVQRTSPVLDLLRNPVAVDVKRLSA